MKKRWKQIFSLFVVFIMLCCLSSCGKMYTITLDAQNGDPVVLQYKKGKKVNEFFTPEKEGYTFIAWDNQIEKMPKKNVTVHAIYKINEYSVTFDYQLDTPSTYQITTCYGETINEPQTPTKTNNEFVCWKYNDVEWNFDSDVVKSDIVLKAEWKKATIVNKYKLTIDKNNGENPVYYELADGEEVLGKIELENPLLEGYTFTNWSEELPTNMPNHDLYIYANYKINSHKLILDLNDGKESKVEFNYNYKDAINVDYIPTKEGYTFLKWNIEIPANMPDQDVTLQAVWEKNKVQLTFVDYYGEGEDYIISGNSGDNVKIIEPSCTGYVFSGFYTQKNGKGSKATFTTYPENDKTLYTYWTLENYKITYELNGGTNPEDALSTFTINDNYSLPIPTKENSIFIGWYKEYGFKNKIERIEGKTAINYKLYAKWEVGEHKITYVLDNGEENLIKCYNTGDTIQSVDNPTKTGYSFIKWSSTLPETMPDNDLEIVAIYEINSYKVNINYNCDELANKSISFLYNEKIVLFEQLRVGYSFNGWVEEVPDTMPDKDINLTAKWKINTYEITIIGYNEEGNYSVLDSYNKTVNIPTPSKTGYTFKGFYTEEKGLGEQVTTFKILSHDVVYYAYYTICEFEIVYNLNGGTNPTNAKKIYSILDKVILLPTPTKENFVFRGWYEENTFTNKVEYLEGTLLKMVHLYAKWDECVAYPVLTETLTYNGSAQDYPTTGFSDHYTLSGDTTGIVNAGAYSISFTLKDGYCWNDGDRSVYTLDYNVHQLDNSSIFNDVYLMSTSTSYTIYSGIIVTFSSLDDFYNDKLSYHWYYKETVDGVKHYGTDKTKDLSLIENYRYWDNYVGCTIRIVDANGIDNYTVTEFDLEDNISKVENCEELIPSVASFYMGGLDYMTINAKRVGEEDNCSLERVNYVSDDRIHAFIDSTNTEVIKIIPDDGFYETDFKIFVDNLVFKYFIKLHIKVVPGEQSAYYFNIVNGVVEENMSTLAKDIYIPEYAHGQLVTTINFGFEGNVNGSIYIPSSITTVAEPCIDCLLFTGIDNIYYEGTKEEFLTKFPNYKNWPKNYTDGSGEACHYPIYCLVDGEYADSGLYIDQTRASCLVEGTLITLADGSVKKIEDIQYDDLLLVKDLINGGYTYEYPIWMDSVGTSSYYTLISFSDGSTLKVVGDHSLYDCDKNYFVDNGKDLTIGSRVFRVLVNEDGEEVVTTPTVTNIETIQETVRYYHVYSASMYNVFANGFLTTYGSFLLNHYGFDSEMKFNEEERAKLLGNGYSQEELSVLPSYMYYGMRASETKGLVDKGYMTYEEWSKYLDATVGVKDFYVKVPTVECEVNGEIVQRRVWAVCTSLDFTNTYVLEGDFYTLGEACEIEGKTFIGYRNSVDNQIYQAGDSVQIQCGVCFIAIYK